MSAVYLALSVRHRGKPAKSDPRHLAEVFFLSADLPKALHKHSVGPRNNNGIRKFALQSCCLILMMPNLCISDGIWSQQQAFFRAAPACYAVNKWYATFPGLPFRCDASTRCQNRTPPFFIQKNHSYSGIIMWPAKSHPILSLEIIVFTWNSGRMLSDLAQHRKWLLMVCWWADSEILTLKNYLTSLAGSSWPLTFTVMSLISF